MAKLDPNKVCRGEGCGRFLAVTNKAGYCTDHNPQRWKVQRERRNEYFRNWNKANASSVKNTKLKKKFGITLEQHDAMVVAQRGMCPICVKPLKKPVVDHCHKTSVVRGILCPTCNQGIGLLYESEANFQRATAYLKQFNTEPTGCWEDLPCQSR